MTYAQEGAKGELKAVLAAWQPAPLPLHVLCPPNRHLTAKVRAFVDWTAGEGATYFGVVKRFCWATANRSSVNAVIPPSGLMAAITKSMKARTFAAGK